MHGHLALLLSDDLSDVAPPQIPQHFPAHTAFLPKYNLFSPTPFQLLKVISLPQISKFPFLVIEFQYAETHYAPRCSLAPICVHYPRPPRLNYRKLTFILNAPNASKWDRGGNYESSGSLS